MKTRDKNDLRKSLQAGVKKLKKHGKTVIATLTKKTRRRIVNSLRNWNKSNSAARKRHEIAMKKHSKDTKVEKDAITRSEQPDRSVIVY